MFAYILNFSNIYRLRREYGAALLSLPYECNLRWALRYRIYDARDLRWDDGEKLTFFTVDSRQLLFIQSNVLIYRRM